MNADLPPVRRKSSKERPGALLRTLVLCDLFDSTALIERLGDPIATKLIRRHDRMARLAIRRHEGREIDKTDGFLAMFERPIQAVAFALAYQRELRELAEAAGQPLAARVGIHVGDVMVWDNTSVDVEKGAKPIEVEGLAKAVAARLMGLGLPGQILLSGVAHTLAQRSIRELGAGGRAVHSLAHGRYYFKGLPEPVPVFEVGQEGVAPFRTPAPSSKATRATPWWQGRLSLALASVVLLLLVSGIVYLSTRSEPALAFAERDWVVIGDLISANGDEAFSSTLATAFRIGMEQSRFVNVVPDQQVREALTRMHRDRTTRIDREVAAEIALREQARAVIMPSVAQYGPKVRLTAELIDPNGTRTVSIHTADADDSQHVLPAIDQLLHAMRGTLGESIKQVQASQPLEKVTTADLQALRAYSQALRVAREGDIEQAGTLLAYATERDSRFATAHALMGSLLLTQQRYADAWTALDKALSIDDRLTERERLYIRAQRARFADPRTMAEQWQMYANLYPDQGTGQNNLGNAHYLLLLDYPAAEAALTEAAATRNPWRNHTLHALGHALLAQEKLQQAEDKFREAHGLSPAPNFFGFADVLMAGGKLQEAARYLENSKRSAPIFELERSMRRATLFIALGDIEASAAVMATALPEAAKLPSPNSRWRVVAATIAIHASQGNMVAARDLAASHLAELASAAPKPPVASLEAIEHLLYAGGWAARLGLQAEAREALAVARQYGMLDRYPVRVRLATLLGAELALAEGRAERAAELVRVDEVKELWEVHELRARVSRALGNIAGEVAELRWMTSHRGLAYAQWVDQFLGQQSRALAIQDAERRLAYRATTSDGGGRRPQ